MQSTRKNNIPLPSLALLTKLAYSSALISAVSFYIFTWANVISSVYLQESLAAEDRFLGIGLGVLAASDSNRYYSWFGLHALSLVCLLLASYSIFRKTSLRRRFKALIWASAILLAVLDITAWFRAPTCSSSNMYVGIVGMLTAFPLSMLALTPLYQMWIYKRWNSLDGKTKRVVIVGGGFAGLYAAMGINKKLGYNEKLEITLLDKKNYFLFPPLLPSAAAGTIETRQVSYPFRRIFETTNIIFRKVEVSKIDPDNNLIYGEVEANQDPVSQEMQMKVTTFAYDYLILAPGSVTQTFNTKGALENAFFMRELNDAVLLRNHVIDCFEHAAVTQNEEQRKELLHFVIVGAGPTGIETATEIYDLIEHVLLKRYPEIDAKIPAVTIIQSSEQILPGWHPGVIKTAVKQLSKMKLNLLLKSRVSEIGSNFVELGSAGKIFSRTIIWCAGVKPSELLQKTGLSIHSSGRIEVNEDLSAMGFNNIFVLGDAAYLVDKKTKKALPPLGQVAFQQGSHAAKNIIRCLFQEKTKRFSYFDFGGLVSVGEHFAAVNLMGVRLSGFIGWLVWRTLYLGKLVGVSNKIRVMIDWSLDLLIERSISQIRDSGKLHHHTSNN